MLGEKLYDNVTEELNKRTTGLNRENWGRYLEGNSLNYSFLK